VERRGGVPHILASGSASGIAGIDVAHALVSDRELRDNPEATDKDL